MDQTNRFNQKIITPDNLRYIANQISKVIERRLLHDEILDLFNFIKQFRPQNWTNMTVFEIDSALIKSYLGSRFTAEGRDNLEQPLIDVHEVLKGHIGTTTQDANYEQMTNVDEDGTPIDPRELAISNIGKKLDTLDADTQAQTTALKSLDNIATIGNIVGFLGATNDYSLQMLMNPQALLRKNYIVLDSRHRDTSNDFGKTSLTSFSWNFLNNSTIATEGAVNSLGNVQSVVKIQSGDIRIPYSDVAFINTYRRVSLLINEFSSQSFIAHENSRYHFMYKSAVDNNMIECTALPDKKAEFEFLKPITQINSLTISFGCPFETIGFDLDRMLMAVGYTNPATLTAAQPHNLQTGDQIYITGFTTGDPTTDAVIISQVNRENGWNATVVNSTTLSLTGLDLTLITAPIAPYNITPYFGSKRIIVPLELTYIAEAKS